TKSLLASDVVQDEMHCLSRTPRSYLVNSYSDVKEVNESRRETYEATWLDLVMETRPED
ncbi:telethonin-like, partial [Clarias magur]